MYGSVGLPSFALTDTMSRLSSKPSFKLYVSPACDVLNALSPPSSRSAIEEGAEFLAGAVVSVVFASAFASAFVSDFTCGASAFTL